MFTIALWISNLFTDESLKATKIFDAYIYLFLGHV